MIWDERSDPVFFEKAVTKTMPLRQIWPAAGVHLIFRDQCA